MIDKIKIKNFKRFKGIFEITLKPGLNILVGDNETGKSTVLEAIHLALTGQYNGRAIRNELSTYMFNKEVVDEYIKSIDEEKLVAPPEVSIEVFFDAQDYPDFEGNKNSENRDRVAGITFSISFDEQYQAEYEELVHNRLIHSLPIEYYEIRWESFSRKQVTPRAIPVNSVLIDSSNYRYQFGSDAYISKVVKDILTKEEIKEIKQAHRKMVDSFDQTNAIQDINASITNKASLIRGDVSISANRGTVNEWEQSLVTKINGVPFNYVGKGAQVTARTELALKQKKADNASIILLEEPECHLSFGRLNSFVRALSDEHSDKQMLITTHSSFVANKLGLDRLILIANHSAIGMGNLSSVSFFKRMAGYDTLRFILCKAAILVEGPSDELVIQRAYMDNYDNKLPIEDNIDVISVGTAFLRFLELADALKKPTCVVTDNDGDIAALQKKYEDYLNQNSKPYIKICYDKDQDNGSLKIGAKDYNYNTLEPKIIKCNDLNRLNRVLGVAMSDEDELRKYMKQHKTECALAIFESASPITYPDYILEAINHVQ